jgi:hypothetical protein
MVGRAVKQSQHLTEHDFSAGFAGQRHDGNLVFGGDLILLAAGLDDCEHRSFPCSTRLAMRRRARPASWQLTENAAFAAGLTLGF